MITPGLLRRSLARAFQWRLILLQLILLAVSGWIAAHPWLAFFERTLGHFPDPQSLMPSIPSREFFDLLPLALGPEGFHPEVDLASAILLSILFGAFFAGAILTVAQEDDRPSSRALLAGGGAWFARMFRTVLGGLIPYGIAGAITGGIFKWAGSVAESSTTERHADHASLIAMLVSAAAFFLATLWLDAARAWFVAQPSRRSAFFAVFAGGWLVLRRPVRALVIGVGTLGFSFALAALLLIARQQLTQSRGLKVLAALVLAELALAVLAWGRAARLLAFVELARADLLARPRALATSKTQPPPVPFAMAPPRTSPPPSWDDRPPAPSSQEIVAVATFSAVAIEIPEPEVPAALIGPSGGGTGSGN